MMDIDESKCCPQTVKAELEFQEYLIQFIQQFCYLGLGRLITHFPSTPDFENFDTGHSRNVIASV